MTDLLFYTIEELAEAEREAFEQGWHAGFQAGSGLIEVND
jgi:hypothetical protein